MFKTRNVRKRDKKKNERDTNTADINLVAHILDVCMVFIYNIQSVMETKIKNKTATFYFLLF